MDASGIEHWHCPFDCEKPQPIVDDATGEHWCGRCWFTEGRRTLMYLCTPEACDD